MMFFLCVNYVVVCTNTMMFFRVNKLYYDFFVCEALFFVACFVSYGFFKRKKNEYIMGLIRYECYIVYYMICMMKE
jgi:hypothetical protein